MQNAHYIIRHLPEQFGAIQLKDEFDPNKIPYPWCELCEAKLDQFAWGFPYQPQAAARVGWNEKGLHVLMYANEPAIRTQETVIGGDVCLDSCLEFFIGFDPKKLTYVNCESNPLCVMHIGVGDGRYGRTTYDHIPEGFAPSHSVHCGRWWAVSYTIPADFILKHFGMKLEPGMPLRGNFYACGDRERNRHYCMYKAYAIEQPDYHRPELFADMLLGGVIPEKIRDIEPFRLCGNIYFVGTSAVSVHLIDTGDGFIMIDTGYPFMRDAILENMRMLGLDPARIRAILHSHGHYDHYGNTEYFKAISGAKTYISRADNEIVNGNLDLSWADELGFEHIPPFDCDVLLDDGDFVELGNTRIHCRLAPGHTAGVMCFFFDVEDWGKKLRAAMHGGIGMGSMRKAFLERRGLSEDLRRRFRADVERLKEIPVDVVLGNHPYQNHTEEKLKRLCNGEENPFIDSDEWKRLMCTCAQNFDQMIEEEN